MSKVEAIEFLQKLRPNGPWVLVAIVPDGAIETITARSPAEIAAFVGAHNGKRNLYYTVNPTRAVTKKPSKIDVTAIEYLIADLDPRKDEESEAAKERYFKKFNGGGFSPRPTALVNSGNGFNGLWRLNKPVPLGAPIENGKGKLEFSPEDKAKIEDVESRCKAIMSRLGSEAGTQNIDRILRLPGTINLPNAVKRKAGRVECPTELIEFNDSTHALDAFPRAPESAKGEGKRAGGGERKLPRDLINMLYLTGDAPAGYPTRSELHYALVCKALREGIDESEIITACLDETYRGCAIFEHCKEKGGRDFVKRQIEKAVNEVAVTSDGKHVVIVRDGDRFKAWRATERALLASKAQVFVRGGQLVEPLWRWEKTAQNRDVLVMSFVPYNVWRLSDVVARHAVEFRKYDGRSKKTKTIDPPEDVINTILSRGDWMFPSVVGIVNTPTMRPDGTILDRPGYDAATQLWYKSSDNVTIPPIPEKPTKEQALAALEVLEKLLVEFPFVDGASKSVALAGIMTPVLRGAFGTAPLFFLVAPNSGTGKSYLVKLISIIATGRPAPVLGSSDDPKEMEKRLSSAARKASPILAMTNLSIDLESNALNQMITDGTIEVRVFGKNELIECDCRGMTVFVDGNNIRLVGDLVRRAMTVSMNAKMERPETRTFEHDPVGLVLADRGKYLAAIFTIARAHAAAGEPTPDGTTPLAGFEEWSRKIRHPLMWLGLTDPAESMEEARDLDPQRTALRELMATLARHVGVGTEFTAAEVHQRIQTVDARGIFPNQDLFDVFSRDGRKATPKSIGSMLMSVRDKISEGRRIVLMKAVGKHAHTYKIEETAAKPEPEPEAPFDLAAALAADPDAM